MKYGEAEEREERGTVSGKGDQRGKNREKIERNTSLVE